MATTRRHRSGSIQIPNEGTLSDKDINDMMSHLWDNINDVPHHIQQLLYESQVEGKAGAISYALVTGWLLGKFDYEQGDPWSCSKAGWVPKDVEKN